MERTLHGIGSSIGKYPKATFGFGFSLLLLFALGGWLQLDSAHDALTTMDFKLLWSNSESSMKTEVSLRELYSNWYAGFQ